MAIFPNTINVQIPDIEKDDTIPAIGDVFKFDFKKNKYVVENGRLVKLNYIDSVKQWIQKCLLTQKNRYNVYKNIAFGTNTEDLIIGELPTPFIYSELKREITEALLLHPHIENINNIEFDMGYDKLKVNFDVELIDKSEIKMEGVNANV